VAQSCHRGIENDLKGKSMKRFTMAFGLCAALAVPVMASSDGIKSGPYIVYYGGYSTPVDSGYAEGLGAHSFCTANGNYADPSNALPWKPKGAVNSFTVCKDGYVYKEDGSNALKALASGKSVGYFAHFRGRTWTSTAGLFTLNNNTNDNYYIDIDFHKGGVQDSLVLNQPTSGRQYTLVDSLGQLFDPANLKSGWVAIEVRFTGTIATDYADFSMSLANRKIWFRTAGTSTVDSKVSGLRGTNAALINWMGFYSKAAFDTVGDFAKIGPVSDADYEWARKRYFGAQLLGDTTFYKPYIHQILYNPPGDLSTQKLIQSTTISSSISVEKTTNSSLYFGAGIEVTPEVFTGEVGASIEAKATAAMEASNGSSIALARNVTEEISTRSDKPCDLVLFDKQNWYGALLAHPRLDKVFATDLQTGTVTNGVVTIPSDYVTSFQLFPLPMSGSLASRCADQYLAYVRDTVKDTSAVRNFRNLYVKDSLGNLLTSHPLLSGSQNSKQSDEDDVRSLSITHQSTTTQTQSFGLTLGVSLDAKIIAGGVSVLFGGSFSVTDKRSAESSADSSKTVTTTWGDEEAWDVFRLDCYRNDAYGLFVCQSDSATSYSSAPWERHTQKSVNLDYTLKEVAGSYTVGNTIVDTLVITNNSTRDLSGYSPKLQVALDGADDVLSPFTALGNTWGQYSLPAQGQSDTIPLSFAANRKKESATLVVDVKVGQLNTAKSFETIYTDLVSGSARALVDGQSTAILARPASILRSTELSANTLRPLASKVSGSAAARLSTGSSGCEGDGCLSLSLSLPSAARVRVSIFDHLGTPVISWARDYTARDLAGIPLGSDGRHPVTLSWNLRASNGAAVASGVYLWKIDATTVDGEKLETVKKMGVK
jgi:hypothetical protein